MAVQHWFSKQDLLESPRVELVYIISGKEIKIPAKHSPKKKNL